MGFGSCSLVCLDGPLVFCLICTEVKISFFIGFSSRGVCCVFFFLKYG